MGYSKNIEKCKQHWKWFTLLELEIQPTEEELFDIIAQLNIKDGQLNFNDFISIVVQQKSVNRRDADSETRTTPLNYYWPD